MTPNVLICASEQQVEAHFSNDFIVHIDGKKTQTLRQFYENLVELLEIPDFSFSLESLNDALNNLEWLDEERIIFYITNTTELLSKERDPAKLGSLLSVLDATAEDWKWTEELTDSKEIILIIEESPRIRKLLDAESIAHKPI